MRPARSRPRHTLTPAVSWNTFFRNSDVSDRTSDISDQDRHEPSDHRPAARKLHAEEPAAAQPCGQHFARAVLHRGRDAEGPLPAVPRGKGQRGHRADDDGRLGGGRTGEPGRVRQPARLQGRGRAVVARAGLRRARARCRGDVPDHPPGPSHEQLRRGLAAGGLSVTDPGARAPGLPEGGRGMGHGPHRAGLCRRHRPVPRSRPGRDRARGLHPFAGRLLVPADQPPRRRVRRQPRGPAALPAAGDSRGPRGRRPGLHRRHPDVVRRGHPRRAPPRRGADDRGSGRRRRRRLHQRDPGLDGQRRGALPGHPADGHPRRAAPGIRRRDQTRGGRAGDARQPDQRCGHRPPRHPRRAAGPGRDDPRPHRRPAHRRENQSGRRGSDPTLCRGQLLPGRDLSGPRRQVHPQPVNRARGPAAA